MQVFLPFWILDEGLWYIYFGYRYNPLTPHNGKSSYLLMSYLLRTLTCLQKGFQKCQCKKKNLKKKAKSLGCHTTQCLHQEKVTYSPIKTGQYSVRHAHTVTNSIWWQLGYVTWLIAQHNMNSLAQFISFFFFFPFYSFFFYKTDMVRKYTVLLANPHSESLKTQLQGGREGIVLVILFKEQRF